MAKKEVEKFTDFDEDFYAVYAAIFPKTIEAMTRFD